MVKVKKVNSIQEFCSPAFDFFTLSLLGSKINEGKDHPMERHMISDSGFSVLAMELRAVAQNRFRTGSAEKRVLVHPDQAAIPHQQYGCA